MKDLDYQKLFYTIPEPPNVPEEHQQTYDYLIGAAHKIRQLKLTSVHDTLDFLDFMREDLPQDVDNENDIPLCQHSIGTAQIAVKTAGASNKCSPAWLGMAGLLHDVGKLVTPDDILYKKGRLTDWEREVIEKHPRDGRDLIAEDTLIPSTVRQAVFMHHENYNGSGYPSRISYEYIPPAAEIIHVADVWDALITARPYKPAYSVEKAASFMELQAGKMFSPDMVSALLKWATGRPDIHIMPVARSKTA